MYESYYGLVEKPFNLTPDPKYLFRSRSHADAFELLHYAVRRREGFVVVTGDIGTGKTTLCRALLEQIDRTTFTALILNPFLSEEDLLKRILQDFGVISRDDLKGGRLSRVTKQELIETLNDFLLGLIPLNARAVLIIDEAQNLPLSVLEQIRILSNLETDKEKLLQIILVGQSNLQTLLRSPEMRQLDQRVSIRYQLKPLDAAAVAAYVAHRLTIAGGAAAVSFTSKALKWVHRLSGGIPRLINLICDRALLAGFSERTNSITPDLVWHAAESLDLRTSTRLPWGWLMRRASLRAAAAGVLLASAFAVGATAFLYQQFAAAPINPIRSAATGPGEAGHSPPRRLPADATSTILVGAYPISTTGPDAGVGAMTEWLESSGFHVYYSELDLGPRGRWQRVLAGAYPDAEAAQRDLDRLKRGAPALDARVVTVDVAAATTATSAQEPSVPVQRAGIVP